MRTDTELQRGVMEALAWEPSIDAAGIGVSVESGIVMLSGTVKSLPQRWTAVRVAQHVGGVPPCGLVAEQAFAPAVRPATAER